MTDQAAKEAMRRELDEILLNNRKAFEGEYRKEIDGLLGLSHEEIDAITPDLTDMSVYDQLIEVVKEASRRNLAQAELKNRIMALGKVAVTIARKVKGLADILV